MNYLLIVVRSLVHGQWPSLERAYQAPDRIWVRSVP